MNIRQYVLGSVLAFVALAQALAILGTQPVLAGENRDELVHKALKERTDGFCNSVLPAWFSSETGMHDENVRALVADCFTGHARLSILGIESDLALDETSLSEVPAALLHKETGINLDIYRPLAGRVLKIKPVEK